MLAAAFTAVDADSGGALALVHGEAGVGKTALVRRFCGEHEATTRILWGACEPLFTPRPLGPFLDIASDAEDDRLSALLAAGALPYEVASELVRELAAGPAVILVVEDAHWADEATLDVLRLLSGTPRAGLCFRRDDDIAMTSSSARIHYGPTSSESLRPRARWCASRFPRSRRRRWRAAGRGPLDRSPKSCTGGTSGNPFFVGEVLAAPCPREIRAACATRSSREWLDSTPRARDLLDAVAVASPRAELWLLEAVAGGFHRRRSASASPPGCLARGRCCRVPARAGTARR